MGNIYFHCNIIFTSNWSFASCLEQLLLEHTSLSSVLSGNCNLNKQGSFFFFFFYCHALEFDH